MSQQQVDSKITPEMAIFIQLDELNGRLARLTDLTQDTIALGHRFTRLISVTDVPRKIAFQAIGYTMYNNGNSASAVYTTDEGPQVMTGLEAGLDPGDSEYVSLRTRQEVVFWIQCAAGGTATVRIRALL